MLEIAAVAQGLLLIEALALSAIVTARTRSIVKGALCLYGLALLWILLFAVLVPRVLPAVMDVDEREIAQVFPMRVHILAAVILLWIPAFVLAALTHLTVTVAHDFAARPEMRTAAGRLKRSLWTLAAGLSASLRRGLMPARDRPYPKWVGVILGLLLSGSAHFLAGRKRQGVLWYLSLLTVSLLGTGLIAFPGSWAFIGAWTVALCGLGLRLIMLVQSCRPVRRIGWHGWLALIIGVACLNAAVKSTTRLAVHAFSISTEHMKPTLVGIHTEEAEDGVRPHAGLLGRLLHGRRAIHWEARTSGILTGPHYYRGHVPPWSYRVGTDVQWLPYSTKFRYGLGQRVSPGSLLWSGFIVAGDHVMVDKLT